MDKDNKILLGAILIILVTLISFNFGDITGKAVKAGSIVAVSPKTVVAGDTITVYVNPGSDGVENLAYFYNEKGLRMPGTINLCGSSKCEDELSVEYKILDTWDNNREWDYEIVTRGYYIKVMGWKSDKESMASFTVERKYRDTKPDTYR